jgi:hypothetical protein
MKNTIKAFLIVEPQSKQIINGELLTIILLLKFGDKTIKLNIDKNEKNLASEMNKTNAQMRLKRWIKSVVGNDKLQIIVFGKETMKHFQQWLKSCSCDIEYLFHQDVLEVQELAKWNKYSLNHHYRYTNSLSFDELTKFYLLQYGDSPMSKILALKKITEEIISLTAF